MTSLSPLNTEHPRAAEHPLLAGRDDDPALVTARETLSYAELRARVAERRAQLGHDRRLVLLGCRRDVETIVSLLAALDGGYPVILVEEAGAGGREPSAQREAILDRYRPDAVIEQRDGETTVSTRDGGDRALHPDLALLLSTSGSTGSPKLVRLSRENLLSNARSIAEYLDLTSRDRGATTLPLHYSYGLSILTSHLATGASVLVTDRSVVDDGFWREAAEAGITSLAGVPHTFDLIEAAAADPFALTSLRCITQAGGRFAPERVRRWSHEAGAHGVDFIVMYGATEATARMAYLPPGLAERRPQAIGRAIPGGALRIDAPDAEGTGELVYAGPNVMMGYAESAADLAHGAELSELRTGDLARRGTDGLFEIVGRASRFVKLYGLRVDLDRIERLLGEAGFEAYAIEREEGILIGAPREDAPEHAPALLSRATGLPARSFAVVVIESLAVTSSGKPDRSALRVLAESAAPADDPRTSADAVDGAADDVAEAVRALLAAVLDRPDAGADDGFASLEGDSLSYVEVALRLERLIGPLPRDWPSRSARELAALVPVAASTRPSTGTPARAAVAATAPSSSAESASTRPSLRRSLRTLLAPVRVETPVVLRAIAIVLVVGTHANLLGVQGGAHLLLGVLGYNLARFQLAAVRPALRVRSLLRAAAMIAVPAVLWIGGVALATGAYDLPTVLLLNSAVSDSGAWSTQWRFWFIEAAVGGILALALLAAAPALHRAERRRPFVAALVVTAALIAVRLVAHGGVTAGPVERYQLVGIAWLLALGWLAARATTGAQRAVVSVVAVVATVGFLGDPLREAVVIVGLLVLLWVRSMPVPRLIVPIVGVVASASLFVYLVHWELYPLLEVEAPLAATLLSFAAGIAVWGAWGAVMRSSRRGQGARRATAAG